MRDPTWRIKGSWWNDEFWSDLPEEMYWFRDPQEAARTYIEAHAEEIGSGVLFRCVLQPILYPDSPDRTFCGRAYHKWVVEDLEEVLTEA